MARLATSVLILCISSIAMGGVTTKIYFADGKTPLDSSDPNNNLVCHDIMVGTKLTIIVSSDVAENWNGKFLIEGQDRHNCAISVRDNNDITLNRTGSIFRAAGERAFVKISEDSVKTSVSMSAVRSVKAGDWFLFDYTAKSVGNCLIDFGEFIVPPVAGYDPWNPPIPEFNVLYQLFFSHVPSRDFNRDGKVDFTDFSVIAAFNGMTNCSASNNCEGTDLDFDGDVDSYDLLLFTEYWLERTE